MVNTVVSAIQLPTLYCSGFARHSHPFRFPTNSKWVLTAEEFPQHVFPPMCAGRGFISRTETMMRLYVLASHVRQLWIDDLWLTGIVGKLAGTKYVILPFKGLKKANFTRANQPCFYDVENSPESLYTDSWKKVEEHRNDTITDNQHLACIQKKELINPWLAYKRKLINPWLINPWLINPWLAYKRKS